MLDKDNVVYTIHMEQENDLPVRGNCSAIDEATDRKNEDAILAQIEEGNDWAWCWIEVTAETIIAGRRYTGSDSLGACSYRDEADFRACPYFEDMKAEALKDLENKISEAMGVPNLDAMPAAEITEFRRKLTRGEIELPLPEKTRKVAITQLSAYCKAKVRAIRHRLAGRIDQALAAEQECDKRYSLLPDLIRW